VTHALDAPFEDGTAVSWRDSLRTRGWTDRDLVLLGESLAGDCEITEATNWQVRAKHRFDLVFSGTSRDGVVVENVVHHTIIRTHRRFDSLVSIVGGVPFAIPEPRTFVTSFDVCSCLWEKRRLVVDHAKECPLWTAPEPAKKPAAKPATSLPLLSEAVTVVVKKLTRQKNAVLPGQTALSLPRETTSHPPKT